VTLEGFKRSLFIASAMPKRFRWQWEVNVLPIAVIETVTREPTAHRGGCFGCRDVGVRNREATDGIRGFEEGKGVGGVVRRWIGEVTRLSSPKGRSHRRWDWSHRL